MNYKHLQNEALVRTPRTDETPSLRRIWSEVFGSVGEEVFFSHFFNTGLCVITEYEEVPAAMGFLVETGDLVTYRTSAPDAAQDSCITQIPCVMIYAVATLRKHRGKGFGTAVVQELIRIAHKRGYPAVVLCPSDDSLFGYYGARTELRDWFYIHEQTFSKIPAADFPAPLEKLSVNKYHQLREQLLDGTAYIKHNSRMLEYQLMLCSELGGGLFRIGDSCAIVELQSDGAVWIKELLSSDDKVNTAIAAIASEFPSHEYVIRTPAKPGEGRRFGMIALSDGIHININDTTFTPWMPWYGPAFD